MRRLAFAAFVLLAGLLHAGPEESAVQIVRLTFGDDDWGVMHANTNYGSGTVVWAKDGQVRVLTCRHVVPDGEAYIWVRDGRDLHPAQFVAASQDADLAIVECKAPLKAAPVAESGPRWGGNLRQWGHSWGARARPRNGPAVGNDQKHKNDYGNLVYVLGYLVDPGDSGSGVFDPDGRLVGVCCNAFRPEGQRGGAVLLADVKKFLAAHLPK